MAMRGYDKIKVGDPQSFTAKRRRVLPVFILYLTRQSPFISVLIHIGNGIRAAILIHYRIIKTMTRIDQAKMSVRFDDQHIPRGTGAILPCDPVQPHAGHIIEINPVARGYRFLIDYAFRTSAAASHE